MEGNQAWRIWLLGIVLSVALAVLIIRLAQFQLVQHGQYETAASNWLTRRTTLQPSRGTIYDVNGNVLAGAGNEYQVGLDLPFMTVDANKLAADIAPYVGWRAAELAQSIDGYLSEELPYMHLANRISQEASDAIAAFDYDGVALSPVPRRQYPEGELLCHSLGYVDFEGNAGGGLERYYQADLQGEAFARSYFDVPSNPRTAAGARTGRDLVLTIDRTVQAAVEWQLAQAVATYEAEGGTILAMDPKTGAIIASASAPCFNPYYFNETEPWKFVDPTVTNLYEPGSVMKLVTMAAALESDAVTPATTYMDQGEIERAGLPIRNALSGVYGLVDMADIIVYSINTGTVWAANMVGSDDFYGYFEKFGFGRPTGIDLAAEASGNMMRPTSEQWTEATYANHAFGQSIAVTPIQMLAAIAAIANDGKLMQPYIVQEMVEDGMTYTRREPQPASIPISRETANEVTAMAVQVADFHDLHLPNHTIAGKTGTAQIPVPESGIYHPTEVIASFVGWFPADDPEVVMLVKLDKPKLSAWGSESAAPTFSRVAFDLVTLLDIPPDSERLGNAP